MTAPLVIGLDLSLTCTGVAGAGWTDNIRPKNLTGHERLAFLIGEVGSFIRCADLAVIEGPSFGGGVKHRHEDLAGLRVMVRQWCWSHDIPYAVVPPSCRALYAAGRGNASKGEVRTAISDRYGIELEGRARYDEADAYALLAMGLHHLGRPLAAVPDKNATGLAGCQWPGAYTPGAANRSDIATVAEDGDMSDPSAVLRVQAELDRLDRERSEFTTAHNPKCECEWAEATAYAVQRIRTALNPPNQGSQL